MHSMFSYLALLLATLPCLVAKRLEHDLGLRQLRETQASLHWPQRACEYRYLTNHFLQNYTQGLIPHDGIGPYELDYDAQRIPVLVDERTGVKVLAAAFMGLRAFACWQDPFLRVQDGFHVDIYFLSR